MSDAVPQVPAGGGRSRWPERLLLLLLLAAAAATRLWKLDDTLFWVDEAESTINALTILEHGVPVDRYLGQPIYENTLVEPSPDSEEYAFRDSSYSRKGLAVYHGWLPLYAIAGSLRLFGIRPDERVDSLAPRHDDWTLRRMTIAARLPSVAAGVLFILVLFLAGREIAGRGVAFAAAIVASFADVVVELTRDARYYALTLLLGTTACWMIWRLARRGRWRDVVDCALALSFLFHTHVVTCVIACAMAALATPWIARHPRAPAKLATLGAIVAAASLPWAAWSGFLQQSGAIPKAWPLLELPGDLFLFLLERPAIVALLAVGVLGVAAGDALGTRLPARLRDAFAPGRGATWFLAAWIVCGWIGFVALMPAVSNVFTRMALPILGPGLLLAGLTADGVMRAISGRARAWLPAVALPAFVFLATDTRPLRAPREEGMTRNLRSAIAWLRKAELPPGTRVYSTPNYHLPLSLYTGLPVQDVAPVRKSFLDRHAGPVVFFEACGPYAAPPDEEIERVAGHALDDAELGRLRGLAMRAAAQRRLATLAAKVVGGPAPDEVPAFLEPLIARIPALTKAALARRDPVHWCPAVFRGFEIDDWTDWWRIYFFRFVDPDARRGDGAAHAARMREAVAEMLPYGWTVFVAPARPGATK